MLDSTLLSPSLTMPASFESSAPQGTTTITTDQVLNHLHNNLVSFDFLHSKSLIFWTNPRTKQIFSALLELNQKNLLLSSNQQQQLTPSTSTRTNKLHKIRPIVESGLDRPSGISVDWIGLRIYWADSGSSRVEYANLDGTYRKTLFSTFVDHPVSVVVHSERSIIFWSDWGDPPRIESAFLDATNRKIIVSSLLSMPNSLVIDFPSDKLYWTDVKQNLIECSGLDGSDRYTIVHDQLAHPISLTVFEDNLYWTNLGSRQANMVSKLSGKNVTMLTNLHTANVNVSSSEQVSVDIKVFHALRQTSVNANGCFSHQCSHICLPNNVSYSCSCPFGYSFEDKSRTKCQLDAHPIMLFTRQTDIRAMTTGKHKSVFDNDDNSNFVLPISHLSLVVSLDYDPVTATVYWSDLRNKTIGRANWNGRQQENIVNVALEAPSGISYDWIGRNIYWTDTGRNVIEVAKSDGQYRSVVVWRSLDQPRDIVVDPVNSVMFWTQWSNMSFSVERAGMDGSNRATLHSINVTRPHGLAIEAARKLVYWTDAARAVIECSHYGKKSWKLYKLISRCFRWNQSTNSSIWKHPPSIRTGFGRGLRLLE